MRRVLYLGHTINGCAADESGRSCWSEEQWESYQRLVRRYKNVILGKNGYENLFQRGLMKEWADVRVLVVSTSVTISPDLPHIAVASIPEALSQIAVRSETHVLFGGGQVLNSAALSQGLVDEIVLDIDPTVVRKGVPSLQESLIHQRFELIGVRKVGRGTIQIHYAAQQNVS